MRGTLVAVFALLVAGCSSGQVTITTNPAKTPAADGSHTPWVPSPASAPPVVSAPAAAAACDEAPARIVDIINASFTNGQQLGEGVALDGPKASTYVAGNIYTADGQRDSSHNAWVFQNGAVFALTKDARRDTMLADGRDLVPVDFFSGDDWSTLGDCIDAAARTAGK